MLLADIKALFEQRGETRQSSATICEALVGMEERPWPEFSRGKPITVRKVAKLLSPFGITPNTIRLNGGATSKGYKLEAFKNAFECYLARFIRYIVTTRRNRGLQRISIHYIEITCNGWKIPATRSSRGL